MNDIAALFPDEDFWLLVTGEPKPPQGMGHEPICISSRWVNWAKRTILDVTFIPSGNVRTRNQTDRCSALSLYLCRLMRILDSLAENHGPAKRDAAFLENLLLGAANIAGLEIDLVRAGTSRYNGDPVLQSACDAGMIQSEEADHWHPGMKSGSGLTTLYKLTALGKSKADTSSPPPPFRWTEQDNAETNDSTVTPVAPGVLPAADPGTTPLEAPTPKVLPVGGETKPASKSAPAPLTSQAVSNIGPVTVHNNINIDPAAVASLVAQKITEQQIVVKPPESQAAETADQSKATDPKPLSDRARTAFVLWSQAVDGLKEEDNLKPTDRQCHNWLLKHSCSEPIPAFETWQRYLREARRHLSKQKNTPRHGREFGRSIVRESDIETEPKED